MLLWLWRQPQHQCQLWLWWQPWLWHQLSIPYNSTPNVAEETVAEETTTEEARSKEPTPKEAGSAIEDWTSHQVGVCSFLVNYLPCHPECSWPPPLLISHFFLSTPPPLCLDYKYITSSCPSLRIERFSWPDKLSERIDRGLCMSMWTCAIFQEVLIRKSSAWTNSEKVDLNWMNDWF